VLSCRGGCRVVDLEMMARRFLQRTDICTCLQLAAKAPRIRCQKMTCYFNAIRIVENVIVLVVRGRIFRAHHTKRDRERERRGGD